MPDNNMNTKSQPRSSTHHYLRVLVPEKNNRYTQQISKITDLCSEYLQHQKKRFLLSYTGVVTEGAKIKFFNIFSVFLLRRSPCQAFSGYATAHSQQRKHCIQKN